MFLLRRPPGVQVAACCSCGWCALTVCRVPNLNQPCAGLGPALCCVPEGCCAVGPVRLLPASQLIYRHAPRHMLSCPLSLSWMCCLSFLKWDFAHPKGGASVSSVGAVKPAAPTFPNQTCRLVASACSCIVCVVASVVVAVCAPSLAEERLCCAWSSLERDWLLHPGY